MTPARRTSGAETETDGTRREAGGHDDVRSDAVDERHGDLVERLRHNVVQLLAHVPHPPRALRVRAGDVSVDVEWGDGPDRAGSAAAPAGPASSPHVPFAPVAESPGGGTPSMRYVTAPAVGTFYRAREPGAPPFVKEGDVVAAGEQVGIIEVMKLMVAINADAPGRIVEVLRADGDAVEFGEPLFALVDETV